MLGRGEGYLILRVPADNFYQNTKFKILLPDNGLHSIYYQSKLDRFVYVYRSTGYSGNSYISIPHDSVLKEDAKFFILQFIDNLFR